MYINQVLEVNNKEPGTEYSRGKSELQLKGK